MEVGVGAKAWEGGSVPGLALAFLAGAFSEVLEEVSSFSLPLEDGPQSKRRWQSACGEDSAEIWGCVCNGGNLAQLSLSGVNLRAEFCYHRRLATGVSLVSLEGLW